MRLTILLIAVCVCLFVGTTDAWWGQRGRSRNNGGGGERKHIGTKIRESVSKGANFVKGAVKGTMSMGKAYKDMRDANWKNSDKYFHARGNYDAAKHGPGGKWAAEKISNAREWVDRNIKGDSAAASAADQAANKWGRSGKNPNKYRPAGLPKKYKR